MNSLQNDFLKRSISTLENLAERAEKETNLSSEFVREVFRTLHTIKGTAQTFGLKNSSKIAHELENLISNNDLIQKDLIEGLAYLIDSLKNTDSFQIKKHFNKNQSFAPNLIVFETEFLEKFAPHEQKIIVSGANKGKKIYLVDAVFELKHFAEDFKNLREKLSVKGEIIATLPGANADGKIGFRFCIASAEDDFPKSFTEFALEIIEQKTLIENKLDKILTQIEMHAKELATDSGKNIEIKISSDKIECSRERLNLIFDILLHLTRNALDHAFERKGKIEISFKAQKDNLKLLVEDDGKGIDPEKIKAKAIEKKMISPDKILTTGELLDLIFLHDFSTNEVLTETSGRGVGLDVVKKLVENAGGTVHVKSQRNVGTTFEVYLRYES